MSSNYIIEIKPPSTGVVLQAGIVVRDGPRFRFFSASKAFDALEGQRFDSPKKAEQAALERIAAIAARKPGGQSPEHASVRRSAG
jgi:hypothetical protein